MPEIMTESQVQAAKARAEKATPAIEMEIEYWETACPNYGYCSPDGCSGHRSNKAYNLAGHGMLPKAELVGDSDEEISRCADLADADSKFFAASRTDVPALADTVQAFAAALEERTLISCYHDCIEGWSDELQHTEECKRARALLARYKGKGDPNV